MLGSVNPVAFLRLTPGEGGLVPGLIAYRCDSSVFQDSLCGFWARHSTAGQPDSPVVAGSRTHDCGLSCVGLRNTQPCASGIVRLDSDGWVLDGARCNLRAQSHMVANQACPATAPLCMQRQQASDGVWSSFEVCQSGRSKSWQALPNCPRMVLRFATHPPLVACRAVCSVHTLYSVHEAFHHGEFYLWQPPGVSSIYDEGRNCGQRYGAGSSRRSLTPLSPLRPGLLQLYPGRWPEKVPARGSIMSATAD
jgi:hypothetical protein